MTQKAIIGAITSFILTGGAVVVALKGMPDAWGWTVIVVAGLMASAKHINAIYIDPNGTPKA